MRVDSAITTNERANLCQAELLRKRGWTQGLVKKYLGLPDAARPGRNVVKLFSIDRIIQVEQTLEFQADAAKLAARRAKKKTVQCDLLPAIFAVNRAAKRHRNAAQKHYQSHQHGLAKAEKVKKEQLYALKDRGIVTAFRKRLIAPVEMHGTLCLYSGCGYSFHSTLRPVNVQVPTNESVNYVFIESQPQGSTEPLQRDAILMLESLPPVDYKKFIRNSVPRPERQIDCYHCGQLGHKASECPENEYYDDEPFV